MGKITRKKVVYQGVVFDSKSEFEYFLLLKNDKNIKDIQLQPEYTLLDSFKVPCKKCRGFGTVKSPKTGNDVQCVSCKGSGKNTRQKMKYTADFLVTYQDGYQEVIDVKGGKYQATTDIFALRRKMFEHKTGMNLAVIYKDNRKAWMRL